MKDGTPRLEIPARVSDAVKRYWLTRALQKQRQAQSGRRDQGLRGAVTGGAQMDGFAELLVDVIQAAGVPPSSIFRKRHIELPGFFRATKQWDLLVVHNGMLLAAIETKSQVGSFGNNFNNRTEEALGSALDLWTAYRERIFRDSPQPFLGYLFMLEDSPASRCAVRSAEPHFKVLREFRRASYCRRYEIFCRKIVLERHYTAAAFITSSAKDGIRGVYRTPAADLSVERFVLSLTAHLSAFV